MTEQKIEKAILDKFKDKITESGIEGLQLIGVWQKSDGYCVKALEDGNASGVLTVKVQPRQYETFTIPYCNFSVEVNLVIRAEMDRDGEDYLATTEAIASVMHIWQKSIQDVHDDLSIDNEFDAVGFRLDGGDCGIDKENAVWSFNQMFTVEGIII